MSETKNVVELLTDQHRHVEKLIDEVASTTEGTARRKAFDELRRMLSVHEAAEEIVTHPALARHHGDVADERKSEEHDAKKMLDSLDGMDVSSAEFDELFTQLKSAVLEHAKAEEQSEFPVLLAECDPEELERMAGAVKAVEKTAPTHPHPSAGESRAANAAVGPLVGLVDRVRDAAKSAMGG